MDLKYTRATKTHTDSPSILWHGHNSHHATRYSEIWQPHSEECVAVCARVCVNVNVLGMSVYVYGMQWQEATPTSLSVSP